MASDKKWALITGVSKGGLGDALVDELLLRGINVIATGLDLEHLDTLNSSDSARLEELKLDVTSPSSISAAVRKTEEITGGQLDILINNAGYGYMMPLMDADIDKVKANFDVNVFGLLAVTQAFFPMLKTSKGMVVNQASIAGLPHISQPFIGTYSASKTAVIDLSDTLRVELAPFGINVGRIILTKLRLLSLSAGCNAGDRRRQDPFLGQCTRRACRHSGLFAIPPDKG